ncbi:MAG TPA: PEP-CTERM-box response regulator transcription factor [Alphaproteobacteria bacterium]|nr:PEP-CTERM-box response regulator transcription factor [Alphaproteobacteria bacterium]
MSEDKPKLLILEDDDGLRRQYRWALSDYVLFLSGTREEALEIMRLERPPIAVVDLGLPPDPDGASEGLAALEAILSMAPETKIIVASGNESRAHALKAVSLGAYDFYQKPIEIDVLRTILDRALRLSRLEDENRRLSALNIPKSPIDGIITASAEMLKVCRTIEKIAPTDVAVLILGESGTGKELVAKAVHQLSARRSRPFVAINCGAIPENLLESELFGHEKGAFTGAVKQTIGKIESAHTGTLFLDEIGDLPQPLQVKLLRFLSNQIIERIGGRQQIQVDVRIVCATNQNLDTQMADGRFREDLYYRLNEVIIRIPALRARGEDSVLLASYFLKRFNVQFDRKLRGFSADAIAAIAADPWRGNVRELENRIKRAVVMADGTHLTAADLELAPPTGESEELDLRVARNRAERTVIQRALAQSNGNLSIAAKLLGVSRPTLYSLLESLGMEVSHFASSDSPS